MSTKTPEQHVEIERWLYVYAADEADAREKFVNGEGDLDNFTEISDETIVTIEEERR